MNMEWYRKKSWTTLDQEEFFNKLNRARNDKRAEYLKIQAIELTQTGKPGLLDVAEQLLKKLLDEYPDDHFNKSSALHTLGKIYQSRKDSKMALIYYKQAIDAEKDFPNTKTGVDLDFSELVLKLDQSTHFELAQQLMEARIEEAIFPIEKYRASLILAAIHKSKGKQVEFERYKKLADESAAQKTSGLNHHSSLGLVKKRDSWWNRIFNRK